MEGSDELDKNSFGEVEGTKICLDRYQERTGSEKFNMMTTDMS